MITYVKGDLFSAPKGSILIHSCNCQGVWGSGIAKQFAERFPEAKKVYSEACRSRGPTILGRSLLIPAGDYTIGCLFTSNNYGQYVDSPEEILEKTRIAIEFLLAQNIDNKPMHMCKINSGLFRVPWEETEKVLNSFNANFTVYEG
jgi:ADP-ribose 1''-phosphate phosphatase